jgi:phospholipid-binding lipoprotein MlaA
MIRIRFLGLLLMAWVLSTGCTHAGKAADKGSLMGSNEMTVRSEAPPTGPAVGGLSENQAVTGADEVSKVDVASEARVDQDAGTASDRKPDLAAKDVSQAETVAEVERSAEADAGPGEARPEEAGAETESAPGQAEFENPIEEVTIADPIEPWNRWMFTFNDRLYFWVMKPVAQGYNVVVPEPVRISVQNFFRNVAMPIRFVNSLLQGKFKGAGIELARFCLNTTVGLAGFFDVATSRFKLDPSREDLGQTLGFYGMPGLMYIVWPFLGPSTVRDSIGLAGDGFLYPVNYISPFEAAIGVNAYERVNTTSLELGDYESMIKSALEPYIAVRDAYIQYRKGLIKK